MDKAVVIKNAIREKGFRLTAPRAAIVDYLINSSGHPDVQQIYDDVVKDNPGIGLATVYRTVEMLTALGFLNILVLNNSPVRYEIAIPRDHHHHLICNQCGRITEFGNCNFHTMADDIESVTRFKIHSHKLEVYGLCPQCKLTAENTGTSRDK